MSADPEVSAAPKRRKWLSRLVLWGPMALTCAAYGSLVYAHRDNLPGFINSTGNLATHAGLLVTLIGFCWTLWLIWETRQAARDAEQRLAAAVSAARRETSEAVAEAREETRAALAKIALLLFQDECNAARQFIQEGMAAASEKKWERALDRFLAGQSMLIRLASYPDLTEVEAKWLAKGKDNLRLTIRSVQVGTRASTPNADLPNARWKPLLALLEQIEEIRTRIRSNILETPHGDEPEAGPAD